MKDVDSAMLRIREQELKLDCIRMAIGITSPYPNEKPKPRIIESLMIDAQKIYDWISK